MTIVELKNILNSDEKIKIAFRDNLLIAQTENLLINNGYKWRGQETGVTLSHISECQQLIIFINFLGNEPKILSYSNNLRVHTHPDISITEETYKLLQLYFNPIPDYKPKKFSREI